MGRKQIKDWRDPKIAKKLCSNLTKVTVVMKLPLKYKGTAIDGLKPDPYTTLARRFVAEFGYLDKSLAIVFLPLNDIERTKEYFWSSEQGLFSYAYIVKNLPFFPETKSNLTGVKRLFSFDGSFMEIE